MIINEQIVPVMQRSVKPAHSSERLYDKRSSVPWNIRAHAHWQEGSNFFDLLGTEAQLRAGNQPVDLPAATVSDDGKIGRAHV